LRRGVGPLIDIDKGGIVGDKLSASRLKKLYQKGQQLVGANPELKAEMLSQVEAIKNALALSPGSYLFPCRLRSCEAASIGTWLIAQFCRRERRQTWRGRQREKRERSASCFTSRIADVIALVDLLRCTGNRTLGSNPTISVLFPWCIRDCWGFLILRPVLRPVSTVASWRRSGGWPVAVSGEPGGPVQRRARNSRLRQQLDVVLGSGKRRSVIGSPARRAHRARTDLFPLRVIDRLCDPARLVSSGWSLSALPPKADTQTAGHEPRRSISAIVSFLCIDPIEACP
jgi:hypothetical protein